MIEKLYRVLQILIILFLFTLCPVFSDNSISITDNKYSDSALIDTVTLKQMNFSVNDNNAWKHNVRNVNTIIDTSIINFFQNSNLNSRHLNYASEFLKLKDRFSVDELNRLFSIIIPFIFDFEKILVFGRFYISIPALNSDSSLNSNTSQYPASELKFSYRNTNNDLILKAIFVDKIKSADNYFFLFNISIISDSNTANNDTNIYKLKKTAPTKTNLIQIKIDNIVSLYKIINLSPPLYFVGVSAKYNLPDSFTAANSIKSDSGNTYLIKEGLSLFNVNELNKLPLVGLSELPKISENDLQSSKLLISLSSDTLFVWETNTDSVQKKISDDSNILFDNNKLSVTEDVIQDTHLISEDSEINKTLFEANTVNSSGDTQFLNTFKTENQQQNPQISDTFSDSDKINIRQDKLIKPE